MATALEHEATTRRWRRVEYERLVDLGVFEGGRLELLVLKERQSSAHAAVSGIVGQGLDAAFGDGWHTRQHSPLALGDVSEPEPDVAGEPLDYIAAHRRRASWRSRTEASGWTVASRRRSPQRGPCVALPGVGGSDAC